MFLKRKSVAAGIRTPNLPLAGRKNIVKNHFNSCVQYWTTKILPVRRVKSLCLASLIHYTFTTIHFREDVNSWVIVTYEQCPPTIA